MVTDRGCGQQASSPVYERVFSPNTVTALPLSSFIPSPLSFKIPFSDSGHIARMPAIQFHPLSFCPYPLGADDDASSGR
jgi:hypothetical protein